MLSESHNMKKKLAKKFRPKHQLLNVLKSPLSHWVGGKGSDWSVMMVLLSDWSVMIALFCGIGHERFFSTERSRRSQESILREYGINNLTK